MIEEEESQLNNLYGRQHDWCGGEFVIIGFAGTCAGTVKVVRCHKCGYETDETNPEDFALNER